MDCLDKTKWINYIAYPDEINPFKPDAGECLDEAILCKTRSNRVGVKAS